LTAAPPGLKIGKLFLPGSYRGEVAKDPGTQTLGHVGLVQEKAGWGCAQSSADEPASSARQFFATTIQTERQATRALDPVGRISFQGCPGGVE
jgi:hypothetical protein